MSNHETLVQWIPREREEKVLQIRMDADFHDAIKNHCKEHRLKMSSFARYALAKVMNGNWEVNDDEYKH